MYQQFFQFRRLPFQLTPDPHFFFFTSRHEEAFNQALFGIKERKGFMVLTGEVGTGKTTLSRLLIEQISSKVVTSLIFNPNLTTIELIQSINHDFGVADHSYSKKVLIDELNRFLLEQLLQGGNAALIVDEAQMLPIECLEELRLLSNLETSRDKLLQIILIGQPELNDKLALPQLRQLNQRITLRAHLEPLESQEVADYIQYRLWRAGAQESVHFEPAAMELVHRYSRGVPRLINAICDRALLAAYVRGTRLVSGHLMHQAIGELTPMLPPTAPPPAYLTEEARPEPMRPRSRRSDATLQLAVAGLISLLAGLGLVWWKAGSFTQLFPPALLASERVTADGVARADELMKKLRNYVEAPIERLATIIEPKNQPAALPDAPAGLPANETFGPVVPLSADDNAQVPDRGSAGPPAPANSPETFHASAGSTGVTLRLEPLLVGPDSSALGLRPPVDSSNIGQFALQDDHDVTLFDEQTRQTWRVALMDHEMAGMTSRSTVRVTSEWYRDEEGVLRVWSEAATERAALLMLMQRWDPISELPDSMQAVDLDAVAQQLHLQQLHLPMTMAEVLHLDYPVVVFRRETPGAPPDAVLLSEVVDGQAVIMDPLNGQLIKPLASIEQELSGPVELFWRPLNGWRWPGPIDGVDPVVKWLQRNLREARLYNGKIDGLLGPETEEALQRLATQRGLAPLEPQSPVLELMISQFLAPSHFPRLHADSTG